MDYEEYERIVKESGLLDEDNLNRYRKVRRRIGAIVRATYKFNENERTLLYGKRHVVIYGCGVYSKHVVTCLDKNHISWDGFVISDNQEPKDKKDGKPVWRLCEYPYDFYDTVVVIGVGQNLEIVVKEPLEEKNIQNVVDSFWVHKEDLAGIE